MKAKHNNYINPYILKGFVETTYFYFFWIFYIYNLKVKKAVLCNFETVILFM